jgi:hypothetical protein
MSSNRSPLRSLPFQPPPAPRRSRLGRKALYLTAGAAVLVLSVAGAVVFANRGNATTEAAPPAGTPHERMLETLGGLSAAHLYQSYLNIGLLADAVENETYTEAQANSMLAQVVSLMDLVDRQLDKLAKMDLSAEDKQDVERIRNLSGLMRTQVAALRTWWRTGDAAQAVRYHDAREKSWAALTEALGM